MKTRQALTVVAVTAILSAVAAYGASSAAAQEFGDSAVRQLAADGILADTDCSIEECDGDLLRWQAALWLTRAFDLGPGDGVPYVDVPADGPIGEAVAALHSEGVTVGCASDPVRYCPDRATTRAEMAIFLARALQLEPADSAGFLDVSPDAYYAGSVDAIYRAGITVGCDLDQLRYCPEQPISHRQAAVMLHRWLQRSSTTPDTTTGGGNTPGDNTGGTPGSNTGGGNTPDSTDGTPDSNTGGTPDNTDGTPGDNTGGTPDNTDGTPGDNTGGTPRSNTPTTVPSNPVAPQACAVVDHVNTHHDIDDHNGSPATVASYALLPDGTLFGHRHPTGAEAKCWMWAPPDADGNQQDPQQAEAPAHTH